MFGLVSTKNAETYNQYKLNKEIKGQLSNLIKHSKFKKFVINKIMKLLKIYSKSLKLKIISKKRRLKFLKQI